ncbi:hypothetical protein [Cohnella terricola]|uniref:Lipoprotein n=1 Tax=Cohnella terricola TaxID=1289167 RepID=A0A559J5Q0_9BACL|nr:hypothetical protein [Cohnella terricola]TVX95203.1 hypothetical protein FPZ45_23985 [Cohnella terricola]
MTRNLLFITVLVAALCGFTADNENGAEGSSTNQPLGIDAASGQVQPPPLSVDEATAPILPIAQISEAFGSKGLLIGLRSDGEDPNVPEPVYDTIWFRSVQDKPSGLLFPQALVWPSASGRGIEALRAFEYRTPEDRIRYIRYEKLGNEKQQLGLIIDEHTEEHTEITE